MKMRVLTTTLHPGGAPLLDLIATHAYVQLDDFEKRSLASRTSKNPWSLGAKNRTADAKITLPEAACLLILFQSSRGKHLKHFVDMHRPTLLRLFPRLPSYSRLVHWASKAEAFLLDFAISGLAEPGDRKSVYLIDSTKIDPHKLKSNPKCLKAKTGLGHTHEGLFIGYKLHVVSNRQGRIVAFDLSTGNRHDLDPVKGGLMRGLSGVAFGDSGYCSAQVRQDLKAQDLALIAKPTSQMADQLWVFDKVWRREYRQRQVVEGVFSHLSTTVTCDDGSYNVIADITKIGTKLTSCVDGTEG